MDNARRLQMEKPIFLAITRAYVCSGILTAPITLAVHVGHFVNVLLCYAVVAMIMKAVQVDSMPASVGTTVLAVMNVLLFFVGETTTGCQNCFSSSIPLQVIYMSFMIYNHTWRWFFILLQVFSFLTINVMHELEYCTNPGGLTLLQVRLFQVHMISVNILVACSLVPQARAFVVELEVSAQLASFL
jgi:hypothetical protein